MRNMVRRSVLVGGLLLVLGVAAGPLYAGENAAKGRAVLAKNGNAVVSVRLVMKMRFSMQLRMESIAN